MRLAIVHQDGRTIDVVSDLSDFDLTTIGDNKALDEEIKMNLQGIQKSYEVRCRYCKAGSSGTCSGITHIWEPVLVRI